MAGHTQHVEEPAVARQPAKTQTPPDPLADLREPDAPGLPEGPSVPGNDPEPEVLEEDVELRPMVSQEVHDQMVAEVIAAWHADPTSQGFLHGGAVCGCRYMARVALSTAVPILTPEDQEAQELEPSSD